MMQSALIATLATFAAASSCTDKDKSVWNADAGHAQWQKQMTSCGTKCLGKESCVTSCMQGDGWSSGCAGCFGALAQCTADHCMFKCSGGRSAGCVSCLKDAGCDTAAFGAGSCTGLDEPSVAAEVAEVAGAGKLAVSFTDCGDASTDAVVKDVTPKTITAGSTTTITGSGSVKKDIAGGSYSMTMTGVLSSVLVKNCNGDASKANTCDIVAPLLGKVGTLSYQPVTFPIKAGDISGVPKVAVTLRAGLPASLETTTTTLKVTASNGDKLICVQIMTKAAAQSVSGSVVSALPPVSMPSVPSISMPPAKAIEDIVCKVAEQRWIEDKATGAICSAVTNELPIPNCQSTLEKMWDRIVTMCPRGLAVEAGTLAVSFNDCGDASTDAVVKDVVPKTITAGSTTTITGSGSLKKDIAGGSYDMRMTGVLSSVLVKNCNGDASKANTCDIVAPLLGKANTCDIV